MPGLHHRLVVVALLVLVVAFGTDQPRAADLLELYERAVEFDPVFQGARYAREIAQQGLREARSGVLPTLDATVEATKVYQDIRKSDNLLFTPGKSNFFNDVFTISLTQPVYSPDTFRRLPQAKAQIRQAAFQYAQAEQDLIIRLAEGHFSSLAARDVMDFATAERRAIQQQLQESQERLTAGLGTIVDVHEARARFALAQAVEIDASNQYADSLQALAEITGYVPRELTRLSETFPLVRPDRPEVDSWVQAAFFQSPRIKAIETQAEIAEQEIQRQRGGYVPSVEFVASFSNTDSGGSQLGEGSEIANTSLGVRARIPIYNGGRSSALIRSSALQHKALLQRLELERRQIDRETRASFMGVISGITQIEALRQSVFSHEAALAAKAEGLRAGLATGLEVLDARRELFEAKRDLAAARYRYILNSLKLKQAAGILAVDDLRQINVYLQ